MFKKIFENLIMGAALFCGAFLKRNKVYKIMNDLSPPLIPDRKPEIIGPIEHIKKFNATFKENIKYEISIYKKGVYLIIETEIKKDSDKIKYSNKYDLKTLKQTTVFNKVVNALSPGFWLIFV